jgi:hypothetical protein
LDWLMLAHSSLTNQIDRGAAINLRLAAPPTPD